MTNNTENGVMFAALQSLKLVVCLLSALSSYHLSLSPLQSPASIATLRLTLQLF